MEDISFKSETKILFKKYKIKNKISTNNYSHNIFLGKNILDNKLVAIKVEKKIHNNLVWNQKHLS